MVTIKRLLQMEKESYLPLLAYRPTPMKIGYSPAEMLRSHKLHSANLHVNHQCGTTYSQLKARDKKVKDCQNATTTSVSKLIAVIWRHNGDNV